MKKYCLLLIKILFLIQIMQAQSNKVGIGEYAFPVKQLTLNDSITLSYVDEGEGAQTLLMIHGLGSYLPAWRKNIPALSKKARCIALDLPNYGRSKKGDYPFSMTFFAQTILEFIEKAKLERVTLVGHSMGGQIALTLALEAKQTEAIEGMVLIAPAGFETFSETEKNWFRAVYTPEVVRNATLPQVERNFGLNFHNGQLPEDARFMYEDRLAMMRDTGLFEGYSNMIPQCVQGMLHAPVFERLNSIDWPVLVIYGKEDLLIPNKILHPQLDTETVAKTGTEQLPNARLELLSPCGHFAQWECAEQVNQLILQFIQQ